MTSAEPVTTRPIADGLFTWPSTAPTLLGGRCGACGTATFPAQDGCPRCGAVGMTPTELGRDGVLWTWTSQGFLPKAPYTGPETDDDFGGYHVGYVELPGLVRVVSRLVDVEAGALRIGMPMELVVVPFRMDDDGVQVVTYAFRPAGSA